MLLGLGRIGGRGSVGGIEGVEFFFPEEDEGELRGLVGCWVWDMCMVR